MMSKSSQHTWCRWGCHEHMGVSMHLQTFHAEETLPRKILPYKEKICAKKWLQKKKRKYVKPHPPSHFFHASHDEKTFPNFPMACGIGCIPGCISISIWESPLQPSKWEIPIWLDGFGEPGVFLTILGL